MVQQDEPSMSPALLGLLSATLLVVPVLTMRLLAEERDRGTLELLVTSGLRSWEIVLGKYIAAMCLYAALMGISVFYYIGVVRCLGADVDHGETLAGALGMLLFGSGLVSIGLMVSAFCRNAMSAVVFTLALFFGLLFLDTLIPWLRQLFLSVASLVPGLAEPERAGALAERVTSGLEFLALNRHIGGFLAGRIELADVAYHGSVTVFCLVMVLLAIDLRRG
jgi:ABC-2 type transport system permease protein